MKGNKKDRKDWEMSFSYVIRDEKRWGLAYSLIGFFAITMIVLYLKGIQSFFSGGDLVVLLMLLCVMSVSVGKAYHHYLAVWRLRKIKSSYIE